MKSWALMARAGVAASGQREHLKLALSQWLIYKVRGNCPGSDGRIKNLFAFIDIADSLNHGGRWRRLENVAVSAGSQGGLDIGSVIVGGQDENSRRWVLGAAPAGNLDAG